MPGAGSAPCSATSPKSKKRDQETALIGLDLLDTNQWVHIAVVSGRNGAKL